MIHLVIEEIVISETIAVYLNCSCEHYSALKYHLAPFLDDDGDADDDVQIFN